VITTPQDVPDIILGPEQEVLLDDMSRRRGIGGKPEAWQDGGEDSRAEEGCRVYQAGKR